MWKIVLKSVDAVVMKNSEFDVSPWDGKADSWNPESHAIFKDLIGQKAQSVQISDQKEVYKIGWKAWTLDHLKFATKGKIVITFEPEIDGWNNHQK